MGQQQWIDLPVPRTMNVDSEVWALADGESPMLSNVITVGDGGIRQRRKFSRVASITALSAAGDLPVTIVTNPSIVSTVSNQTTVPTRALVTVLTGQSGKFLTYRQAYPGGPIPSGYSELTTQSLGVFVNADDPNNVTTGATTAWYSVNPTRMLPFGQSTNMDFSAFFTSIGRWNEYTKTGTAPNSCRLVRWGGQNRATASIPANVTVGTTVVTVTGNPTPSLAGTFMRFNGSTGAADPVGKRFNYYVLSHVAGSNTVILSKPFGLGQTGLSNHVGLADVAEFQSAYAVLNSPPDCQSAFAYLSRIFVGRPTVVTAVGSIQPIPYPNAVAWSDPNEPELWTDTNIAILDNNPGDMVMGFGSVPNALVIFRRYTTWIMTGTDESSFTFRQVSGELGCVDPRSISPYRNGVFFMSDTGLYFYDGYDFTNITQPKPGHGIRTNYVSTAERFAYPETFPLTTACTTILPRSDYLLMLGQNAETASDARHVQYLYHIPSGSWSQFKTANTDQLVLLSPAGKHLNNQGMGCIGSEGIVKLDTCVEPEFMSIGANQGRYDESYDVTTGANTSFAVTSFMDFGIIRPFGGQTGRLHRAIVEHNIWKNTQTVINGPYLGVGADPYYGDVQVAGQSWNAGIIAPRYQPTETASLYTYRYSTEVGGTNWPLEGTSFWVWITTEGVTLDASNASHPPKIYNIRLLLEPTDHWMVDNPVTS